MRVGAKATVADPTAATLAAYAAALGMAVKAETLTPWLNLLAVVFFELGAAVSLIVVGTLAPVSQGAKKVASATIEAVVAIDAPKLESEAVEASKHEGVEASDGKQRGRKRAKPLDVVVERIRDAGGKLEGSLDEIGAHLGVSKSSAHRALNTLAAAGLVSLAASPAGTLVTLR